MVSPRMIDTNRKLRSSHILTLSWPTTREPGGVRSLHCSIVYIHDQGRTNSHRI